VDQLYRTLLERAEAAAAEAYRLQRQASEMNALAQALRTAGPGEIVRCAWCSRLRADEYWLDPHAFLGDDLVLQLDDVTSHGICPDCYGRVSQEAEDERSGAGEASAGSDPP
jgi:hypothetical protein